ncbi:MAG: 3-hydroxyacyl-CoA dehydrogenase NAD-binding domain-containing protein [Calditrichia bacterium]
MNHFQLDLLKNGILQVQYQHKTDTENLLDASVFSEIEQLVKEIEADKAIRGVLLNSSRPGVFCGGQLHSELFDISVAEELYQYIRIRQDILKTWKSLPLPTIALIHGTCFDAGLDWILAFDGRIGSWDNATRFGTRVATHGLLPAYGSTVYFRPLIQPKESFALLAGQDNSGESSASFSADKAKEIGLLDEIAYPEILHERGIALIENMLSDPKYLVSLRKDKKRLSLGGAARGKQVLRRIIKKNKRAGVGSPAEDIAKSLLYTMQHNQEDGLQFAARKAAIHAASSETRCRLYASALMPKPRDAFLERDSRQIAVAGAGRIGRGITMLAVLSGHPVILKDQRTEALLSTLKLVADSIPESANARGLGMDLLAPVTEFKGFSRVQVVFEAIPENSDAKKELFSELAKRTQESTILVTSASTMPVTALADTCKSPSRIAGVHFHYPLKERRFVEVVAAEKTSEIALARLSKLLEAWGLTVVRSTDTPGYVLNRLLTPFYSEAFHLLKSGVSIEAIDAAMREFGYRLGPYQLMQRSGISYAYSCSTYVQISYPERMAPSDLPGKLNEYNRQAEKPMAFYRNAALTRVERGVYKMFDLRTRTKMSTDDINERLNLLLLNEALSILEDGVVASASDIEKAVLFGMGFPAERGGLLYYGKTCRWKNVLSRMRSLSETIGRQYTPVTLLEKVAESGDLDKALSEYRSG